VGGRFEIFCSDFLAFLVATATATATRYMFSPYPFHISRYSNPLRFAIYKRTKETKYKDEICVFKDTQKPREAPLSVGLNPSSFSHLEYFRKLTSCEAP
jgi:hypothetical protein